MSVVFDVKLLNILGFVDDKPGIVRPLTFHILINSSEATGPI
jgi:hypothetical protein